ncbi:MAG: hypothetical protein R3332_03665 [Pseudohongiellaceae bacterium]|nr:hypothetical protein [Pseudohongiellaceae bacterium]
MYSKEGFVVRKSVAFLLLLVLLQSCSSTRVIEDWPSQLPEQAYFLDVYHADEKNRQLQSELDYLTWVVRFYQGWELMPTGWKDLRENMLFGLVGADLKQMQQELRYLGAQISAEWAKDNSVRKIDTAMLSLWGSVIQSDFALEARKSSMQLITEDVERVLDGSLEAEAVNEQRYAKQLELSLNP